MQSIFGTPKICFTNFLVFLFMGICSAGRMPALGEGKIISWNFILYDAYKNEKHTIKGTVQNLATLGLPSVRSFLSQR
ncbi:MAG: hypothetical protein AABX34_05055, partial [Nanoarchaeota archaeon]